jgi:phosphoglycerate dehydrogenase-like enzyme
VTLPLVYLALSPELVEGLFLEPQLKRLKPVAQVERWMGPSGPSLETVTDALRRAQIVLTGWDTPALTPLADWTPKDFAVRLIAHSAGTVKHLLPVQTLERGLIVTHANDALAESVADFTIGAILAARRQMFASAARMKTGQAGVPLSQMHELRGSTVGVIAASNIGRRVMRLLAPWDVTLLLYDPHCSPQVAAEHQAVLVSLDELLRRSDIVSLHAPITKETIGMLGAAQFAAMKDGALFANTARGVLIDHAALLRELQSSRLSALLDVTDPTEPLPPNSPFFALENCVVLPHMAANTVEARQQQSKYIIDEILRFIAGEPLRHQVTRERWDIMA